MHEAKEVFVKRKSSLVAVQVTDEFKVEYLKGRLKKETSFIQT